MTESKDGASSGYVRRRAWVPVECPKCGAPNSDKSYFPVGKELCLLTVESLLRSYYKGLQSEEGHHPSPTFHRGVIWWRWWCADCMRKQEELNSSSFLSRFVKKQTYETTVSFPFFLSDKKEK